MTSKAIFIFCSLLVMLPLRGNVMADFPKVSEKAQTDWFPLGEATICTDAGDDKVVSIAAQMLADDVERVTAARSTIVLATSLKKLPQGATVVAGTLGHTCMHLLCTAGEGSFVFNGRCYHIVKNDLVVIPNPTSL